MNAKVEIILMLPGECHFILFQSHIRMECLSSLNGMIAIRFRTGNSYFQS